MRSPISIEEMRQRACRRIPRLSFDNIDGGAEDESSIAATRQAFRDLALVPKVLAGIGDRNLRTSVLGCDLTLPVILGPTGLTRLTHRDGELAVVRAAGAEGTVYTLSTGASSTIEEVAAA